MIDAAATLRDPARLSALRRIALLETPDDEAFDRLTRLAATILRAPIAIVSLVDEERVYVKSRVGIPEPWASMRELELSASFSRHVIASHEPLTAEDLRRQPELAGSRLAELGGVGFAAIPLLTPDGYAVGSFCVADTRPRSWTDDELDVLADLAHATMNELEVRSTRLELERRVAEAEHERQLRADLLERMTDAFVEMDPEARFTYVNSAAERLLQRPREELLGSRAWDAFPDAVTTRFYTEYELAAAEGGPIDFEELYEPLAAWFRVRAYPSPNGTSVFFQNVTERRGAEEELRRAEAKYRKLVEQIPLVTYIDALDEVSSNIYTSPQTQAILGYSQEAWLIDPELFPKVLHEDDRDRVLAEHARTHATGEPLCTEYRIVAPDGRIVWVHDEAVIVRDDEAEPLFLQGFLLDITERMRIDDELRRAELRYRTLVEESPLGIYSNTADGTRLYISPKIEEMLGYPASDFVNFPVHFSAILHPDDRDRVLAETERAIAEGNPFSAEYRTIAADGRVVWILDQTVPVLDADGETLYRQGFVLDISNLKALEEQLREAQKMEAIGRLAGGVAHDFNNALTAIGGYSELLMKRLEPGDRAFRDAERIRQAADRAAALTAQLLAFSRRQMLQPRIFDLSQAVKDVEPLVGRLLRENVELETNLAPEGVSVDADRGQLEQVIVNLALNARDAMPDGGRLTIETVRTELDGSECPGLPAGAYAMVAVSDTGLGMDLDTQVQIFEPFFTTKELADGAGLGLASVYGVVKQSGGDVSVASRPGEGTTFRIFLPLAADSADANAPRANGTANGSETVLLAEDEEVVRALVREILEENGYSVLEAVNGASALELSERHGGPIDLLLTDVVMPGMSGRELAERLSPVRPTMRVLYMSGYTDGAVVSKDMAETGNAFLQKPFTADHLAAKVREVFGDRPARR